MLLLYASIFGVICYLAIDKWTRFWYLVPGNAVGGTALTRNLKHVGSALEPQGEC